MTETSASPTPISYPIQLKHVAVVGCDYVAYRAVNQKDEAAQNFSGQMHFSHSPFKPAGENRSLHIKVGVSVGERLSGNPTPELIQNNPYFLNVEVVGVFEVSADFSDEHVNSWAQSNGTYLVYPFLREQVYGLTSRFNVPHLILPLYQIPTFSRKEVEEVSAKSIDG